MKRVKTMLLQCILSAVVSSCLLRPSEAVKHGNCFPYDAQSKNSSLICEGDFVSIGTVWIDNSPRYWGIRQQPERDYQNQRVATTTDLNDTTTSFQIFPMAPWTKGTPPGWSATPKYIHDSLEKGPIYPFKLKDAKGRWLKSNPPVTVQDGKYASLYVDNMQSATDNSHAELFYVPNYIYTLRSSSSGNAPSGWILRSEDGVVIWKNGYNYNRMKKRDVIENVEEVEEVEDIEEDVIDESYGDDDDQGQESRLQRRFFGLFKKKSKPKDGSENDELILDLNGPLPSNYPGCETLSLWTIEQTLSPPAYTGYIEKVVDVKYDLDQALKRLVLSNEVEPNNNNASIVNSSPTEQNLVITMSTSKSNSWTFSRDRRYSFSSTGSTWVGLPGLGTGMQMSVSSEFSRTAGSGQSNSSSTHFSVSVMVPVPPVSIMSGQLWLTKAEIRNVPLTYSVVRQWPNGDQVSFDVHDSVDVVQYYDAVICISKALNISLGVTPGCIPPPFRMWSSNGTEVVLPFITKQ
ncbi:hypothetical protein SeMB42_g03118 [Synchytrium endobioticum]|uniref:Uncharacterized protein n=1 Tax=Synchytrium endobioticum TaxID=286115 RepID=A0A507D9C7_9FUNG|nr:hypothetical protein SeLEV6574_g05828 [Synchytrium endobioticum]TPX48114.1 hypothetical protein SeMB42_g03118 [Synchytrium endobioticum]